MRRIGSFEFYMAVYSSNPIVISRGYIICYTLSIHFIFGNISKGRG